MFIEEEKESVEVEQTEETSTQDVGKETSTTTGAKQVGERPTQRNTRLGEKRPIQKSGVMNTTSQRRKTFSQQQVNELMRNRLEKERNSVYRRYGVKDKAELDSLFNNSKKFSQLLNKYGDIQKQNQGLTREIAFSENNVNPNKISDIEAYFKGKGIKFTRDSLKQEMATHPEWLKVVERNEKPKTTINQISTERGKTQPVNEKSEVAKLFGLERLI